MSLSGNGCKTVSESEMMLPSMTVMGVGGKAQRTKEWGSGHMPKLCIVATKRSSIVWRRFTVSPWRKK